MEKLKELLGEELYNQLVAKLGDTKIMVDDGNFIPKSRFDEVNNDRQSLKDMLKERDAQLEELKKKAGDSEALKTKIEELQQANETTVNEYEEKLKKQSFNFAVESALAKFEAKNVKAVKALLDLEKIKLDGQSLLGLEDQVTALKYSDPYLFGAGLHGRKPNDTMTQPHPQKNPWSKEHFNLTEQGRILREDPERAQKLKAQAVN